MAMEMIVMDGDDGDDIREWISSSQPNGSDATNE
jgi:hypothetical protein